MIGNIEQNYPRGIPDVFERLRTGTSRREELVGYLAGANEQQRFLTLEQLTREIVAPGHWSPFLRQLGRAIRPYTKKIALAGSVLLAAAYFVISGGAEKPPAPVSPVSPSSTPTRQPDSSPTPTRTASPTPTEIKPTVTPTSTPKPEATPTPEKKLYPDYGVSVGDASTEDGKSRRGMVMISYLPQPVGKWCMYYFLHGNLRNGERAFTFTLNQTGSNLFESVEKRYEKVKVSFGEDGSIRGTVSWGTEETFTFTLLFNGKGWRVFLDGLKTVKLSDRHGGTISDEQALEWLKKSGITPPP